MNPDDAPQFGEDWDKQKAQFASIFASKTQAEWCKIFDDTDACVTPVIPWNEAASYPHNAIRGAFQKQADDDSQPHPVPAPALSRTPAKAATYSLLAPGCNTVDILKILGYNQNDINKFISNGSVEQTESFTAKL